MKTKRFFDFLTALIFSIAFLPLWIGIGLLIKFTSKGPVFFRQTRIGLNGKPFLIFKFRTMIEDTEKKGLQITTKSHDPRITNIGFFLRKTKIDELPQLFNVIKGEMSLVGPRPEVPQYVELYSEEQKKVLPHPSGPYGLGKP